MATKTNNFFFSQPKKQLSFHKIKPKRQCFWCDKVLEANDGEEVSLHLICFECRDRMEQEEKENDM